MPATINSSTPTDSLFVSEIYIGRRLKETRFDESEGARGDLAASKGATSPASSLSSQSGSLKSGTPYLQELTGRHRQRICENEPQNILSARRGGEAAGIVPVAWGRGKQAVEIEHSRRRSL
jgi:hypothetical protein